MKKVVVDQLSKVYGRNFALHRVSLEFEAGTATALIGGKRSEEPSTVPRRPVVRETPGQARWAPDRPLEPSYIGQSSA